MKYSTYLIFANYHLSQGEIGISCFGLHFLNDQWMMLSEKKKFLKIPRIQLKANSEGIHQLLWSVKAANIPLINIKEDLGAKIRPTPTL